ncbi:Perchlorate reductase subunit gamma precursor [Rubripirellula obstinata]|uniref:Perchlorate reductase subunit gamma n=1 Tax=Rubripirellula obstinata TaxID=406547 RepID=A0A5B1CRR7_9BACT|nr:multiheme c-type cytochrome [Rubripirellula obstinata]KAA1262340.1 Perchlorate reductase subunit gamma precursor [Rubripirellula obstinata]
MSLESLPTHQTTASIVKRHLALAAVSAITTLAWVAIAAAVFALTSCLVGCVPADSLPVSEPGDEQFSVKMPGVASGNSVIAEGEMSSEIAAPQLAKSTKTDASTVAVRLNLVSQPADTETSIENSIETATETASDVEVIPTPKGKPESDAAIREAKLARALEMERKASEPKPPSIKAPSIKADLLAGAEPETYKTWDMPTLTLVFTGNQHGYIEPCGCTGLERQKGGVARRFSFLETLKQKGWTLVPMDVGNQVRRFGQQATIKLQQSARALTEMNYQAVGFGPEDIRLGVGDLLAVAASDSPEDALYVSANVVLFDPEMLPQTKVVEKNGIKVGVTSILDPEKLTVDPGAEVIISDMVPSAQAAIKALSAKSPDFKVLMFYGKEESAEKLVREVPGFDLVVVAGGYGEPTYQPAAINDSETKMILTGAKGMYAGLIGLYAKPAAEPDANASAAKPTMKYARVALTHEFADAPEMRGLMKDYQDQLESIGLDGLGLMPPIPHSSGNKFVGTATCGKCHTEALEVWEGTSHAYATDSIVEPPEERGDVPRHFDPECISCHVTGWNPQEYYPYESGYTSLEESTHLLGNGCENCHGPGAEHSAAEAEGSDASSDLRDQLRAAMRLPMDKAREKCMECHDLDNSIDFHEPDAFEDVYWPQVEHYGLE